MKIWLIWDTCDGRELREVFGIEDAAQQSVRNSGEDAKYFEIEEREVRLYPWPKEEPDPVEMEG